MNAPISDHQATDWHPIPRVPRGSQDRSSCPRSYIQLACTCKGPSM